MSRSNDKKEEYRKRPSVKLSERKERRLRDRESRFYKNMLNFRDGEHDFEDKPRSKESD
ncbi:hypothetical protein ACFL5V_07135 [Fibrobacterota bacterium]